MRVAVFCTGKAELYGIAPALGALFPAHTFVAVPRREEPSGQLTPFEGLTTTRLRADRPLGTHARHLIEAVSGALVQRRDQPDFIFVLDDLELCNADQPEVVISQVREAFRRQLGAPPHQRLEAAFRERVSFHLAVPMMESWLLADPTSMYRAGLEASRQPQVAVDPELFIATDEAYLGHDEIHCPRRDAPWSGGDQVIHPKKYVRWLWRGEGCRTRYRETHEGAAALGALDWPVVLAQASAMTWLRAMVADLEDALGESCPRLPGDEAPWVSRSRAPRERTLRNV